MGTEQLREQNYQEALRFLDSLQFHKIKLGLGPMREFLALVGNPEEYLKIIHVAGTNGKGSVCAGLVSVLQEAGFRTGLYTSPHLASPRERFRINNTFIPIEDFTRITEKIRDVLNGSMITYFEFTTALALLWFYEQTVDFVVLETGLGGRLDATNVVRNPLLTIITSISMDHEMYLGDTLDLVASEKAGIVKSGVPVVCGNRDDKIVSVIEEPATELEAPLYCLGKEFDFHLSANDLWLFESVITGSETRLEGLVKKNPGVCQLENSSLVLAAVQLLQLAGVDIQECHIRQGLLNVEWPGRLELLEIKSELGLRRFLLDGAHNPAGVRSLIEALPGFSFNRLICIWGAMADKNIMPGLSAIAEQADYLVLSAVDSPRGAKPQDMIELLAESQKRETLCCESSEDALHKAMTFAEAEDLILVAGSLYLIGELRPVLVGELVD